MLFHRSQDAKIALYSFGIIVLNVVFDHIDQFPSTHKPPAIIAFSLQDTPEAFHWPVVDTMCYTGHALCHAGLFESAMEHSVCVLESPVTMEQRMCLRVGFDCHVQSSEYQRIVIAITDNICDDTSVTEVENSAKIELVYFNTFIPSKLCDIRKPLFVGLVRVELTVEQVFCDVLRILCLPGTAMITVLDR